MKVKITREQLLEPLQHVIGAVERRQTMPALANILIKTGDNELKFTTTDLEIELVSSTSALVDEAGETTIPARKLFDICKNLPEKADITLSVSTSRATLSSGKSRFVLSTLPANEFPTLEDLKVDSSFSLPQAALKKVIEKTSFAMAQQDVRYYLNGLMLEATGTTFRSVATDGHRLSLAELEMETPVAEERQVIVPRKGILELQRLLQAEEGDVKIELSSNHIRATLGQVRFTSKLIDGRFPDYRRVMPQDSNKPVLVDRLTFRQSLTRTSILSNEKYRGIRLIIENGLMKIQTQNPEQEEAEEEIEAEYQGESIEVGFNVNYIIDVLGVIDDEKVQLLLKDANSSCLLSQPGVENYQYVIMPMRL